MQSHIKKIGFGAKGMQATQPLSKRNQSAVDRSIKEDDAQCMVKGVTTVADQPLYGSWTSAVNKVEKKRKS